MRPTATPIARAVNREAITRNMVAPLSRSRAHSHWRKQSTRQVIWSDSSGGSAISRPIIAPARGQDAVALLPAGRPSPDRLTANECGMTGRVSPAAARCMPPCRGSRTIPSATAIVHHCSDRRNGHQLLGMVTVLVLPPVGRRGEDTKEDVLKGVRSHPTTWRRVVSCSYDSRTTHDMASRLPSCPRSD